MNCQWRCDLMWMLAGVTLAGSHLSEPSTLGGSNDLFVVAQAEPESVFSGGSRKISVVWRNQGDRAVHEPIHLRLYQANSATAAAVGVWSWKTLELLPGQTVLESAALNLPLVRAETRYMIQWLNTSNRVLGVSEVLAYPTNLLSCLEPLTQNEPIGAYDPSNLLKPLLKSSGLAFLDLESTGLEDFAGTLAIIGPFESAAQLPSGMVQRIKALARRGAGVVWMQPPPARHETLNPTFCSVLEGKGTVVIVQSELVAGLAENPRAQLNLIECSRLAVKPQPFRLPELDPSP